MAKKSSGGNKVTTSEMAIRILIGLLLFGIVSFFLLFLRQRSLGYVDGLILFFVIFASVELFMAFRKLGYHVLISPLVINVLILLPFHYYTVGGVIVPFILSILLALIVFTLYPGVQLKDLFATMFTLVYPLLLLELLIDMNHYSFGFLGLMLVFLISVLADTFAFFFGIIIGGKKLAPRISPNKTVGGLIGAILGGLVAGTIMILLFAHFDVFNGMPNVGITHFDNRIGIEILVYLSLGLIGALFAVMGDLVASWLKRSANIKDFGRLLPGHGGVLDRIDSFLFVTPFIFIMLLAIFGRAVTVSWI